MIWQAETDHPSHFPPDILERKANEILRKDAANFAKVIDIIWSSRVEPIISNHPEICSLLEATSLISDSPTFETVAQLSFEGTTSLQTATALFVTYYLSMSDQPTEQAVLQLQKLSLEGSMASTLRRIEQEEPRFWPLVLLSIRNHNFLSFPPIEQLPQNTAPLVTMLQHPPTEKEDRRAEYEARIREIIQETVDLNHVAVPVKQLRTAEIGKKPEQLDALIVVAMVTYAQENADSIKRYFWPLKIILLNLIFHGIMENVELDKRYQAWKIIGMLGHPSTSNVSLTWRTYLHNIKEGVLYDEYALQLAKAGLFKDAELNQSD